MGRVGSHFDQNSPADRQHPKAGVGQSPKLDVYVILG